MDSLPLDTVVRRGDVLWRRSGDQVMIRRRGVDSLTVLAGTGVALWDALHQPVSVAELAEVLAGVHDAPVDVVESDVGAAVATLIEQGVIEQGVLENGGAEPGGVSG
ncbi:MAG: PqqD family protein [Actinomycetota bacterium]